ncbi:hypothetical protein E4T39_07860 [Aureobasidium subglaciale]|nr:hypothetical protein E4T39_07860 [Aureobasidium subglaciale]
MDLLLEPLHITFLHGLVFSLSFPLLRHLAPFKAFIGPLDDHVALFVFVCLNLWLSNACAEPYPNIAFLMSGGTFSGCGLLLGQLLLSAIRCGRSVAGRYTLTCISRRKSFQTADASECREIIRSGTPSGASKNILPSLEARARPNQRLKLAFGIDTCFTSASFEKLLYVPEVRWFDFAETACRATKHALNIEGNAADLSSVVQLLTLKTMREVLWPDRDPEQTTDQQISTLAHEVNMQWLRSKGSDDGDDPLWLFDKQTSLKNAVKAIFPDWDETDSKSNPCNLILPGYETMWRVVLRCYLEIKARDHSYSDIWTMVLWDFAKQPTKDQLQKPIKTGCRAVSIAAIHIAKEALRLYPPTRRIYREHRNARGQKTNVSADIEAMQRDPAIWKDQPNVFLPERWIGVEFGYDEGYMPFGASPFNCPAKRSKNVPMPFGLSMIALLVGALLEVTEGAWKVYGEFPDREQPLDTDREAYSTVVLGKILL